MNGAGTDLAFDYDCLGCLMEAHQRGAIGDELYTEILDTLEAEDRQWKGPCPRCGQPAYISQYEPNMMHCPSCGLYSFREHERDEWVPALQGIVHAGPQEREE